MLLNVHPVAALDYLRASTRLFGHTIDPSQRRPRRELLEELCELLSSIRQQQQFKGRDAIGNRPLQQCIERGAAEHRHGRKGEPCTARHAGA